MKKKFLSLKEAAEVAGVNPQTMKKIITSNGFHYTRLGRKILINEDEMIEFFKTHKIVRY